MIESYSLYQILTYSSISLLMPALAFLKFKQKKNEDDLVIRHKSIDFTAKIVLKNVSLQGEVCWEIHIKNVEKHPIKALRAEVNGSCLLLDNSNYLIASTDNLIKSNYSIAANKLKKIPFTHHLNPKFMPRDITLGCSLKLQDKEGEIEKFDIPLLFSKQFLFSPAQRVVNKVEQKVITEETHLKKECVG